MIDKPLTPFERWMVKKNLEYAQIEGLEVVVARLRANGYNRVAKVVETEGKDIPNSEVE